MSIILGTAIFLVNQNNQFLLGKRVKQQLYGLPGGHIQFGQSYTQTAKRELLQQTGINIPQQKFHPFFVLNCRRPGYHCIDIALAVQYSGQQVSNPQPDKCQGWFWVDWNSFQNYPLFAPLQDLLSILPPIIYGSLNTLPKLLN